jgi:hypothetical protein
MTDGCNFFFKSAHNFIKYRSFYGLRVCSIVRLAVQNVLLIYDYEVLIMFTPKKKVERNLYNINNEGTRDVIWRSSKKNNSLFTQPLETTKAKFEAKFNISEFNLEEAKKNFKEIFKDHSKLGPVFKKN